MKWQVGELKRGLNPLSFKDINFDPKYISAPIRAGVITAFIALAVRNLLNFDDKSLFFPQFQLVH